MIDKLLLGTWGLWLVGVICMNRYDAYTEKKRRAEASAAWALACIFDGFVSMAKYFAFTMLAVIITIILLIAKVFF